MATTSKPTVKADYEADETAWLETMSELIRAGRLEDLDYPNLAEYLSSMAKRDRREVTNRLGVLIAHLLKWRLLPGRRSRSWRHTIETQRQHLADLLESGSLRAHASEILTKAYSIGVRKAAAQTGLAEEMLPAECPDPLDVWLSATLPFDID